MVEISIVYRGGLHTEATHGPSGRTMDTDAPVDNGGRGESFSPTDLVATALGTCMLTIMAKVADRDGIPLEGARVKVTKHMVADPARRIRMLDVEFTLPDVEERDRKKLERAALTCPVHRTLGDNVEIPVRFGWGEL
ncbi:MAG: OsmC family protein [Planctomycetota bacterium]